MNYRNISLEIKQLKEVIENLKFVRKSTSERKTEKEAERYEMVDRMIWELERDLKEAELYRMAM